MQNVIILLVFILAFKLPAQDNSGQLKRKVYRTQTGSIIEAPQPLFERSRKKLFPKKTKYRSHCSKGAKKN